MVRPAIGRNRIRIEFVPVGCIFAFKINGLAVCGLGVKRLGETKCGVGRV